MMYAFTFAVFIKFTSMNIKNDPRMNVWRANRVDPDQVQSDWVPAVCFYLHQSNMQQTTYTDDIFR